MIYFIYNKHVNTVYNLNEMQLAKVNFDFPISQNTVS